MNSLDITAYIAPFGVSDPTRDVCGTASTNNPADPEVVYFRARLVDNGEPGGSDTFALKLANTALPYEVPLLQLGTGHRGGNIQLHAPNTSTTRPLVNVPTACRGLTFNDSPPE